MNKSVPSSASPLLLTQLSGAPFSQQVTLLGNAAAIVLCDQWQWISPPRYPLCAWNYYQKIREWQVGTIVIINPLVLQVSKLLPEYNKNLC
jgi:hypothetical protein